MSILEIKNKQVVTLSKDDLNNFFVQEQESLRGILRDSISVISPNLLVIAEKFSYSKIGKSQIDLLCMDRNANLVVIEFLDSNKAKSENLNSIRNSALISKMTFDETVKAYQDFLKKSGESKLDAQDEILEFLDQSFLAAKASFAKSIRIILISKEVSEEIKTTAHWLNNNGTDISWVSINRFQLDGRLLVETDQIIPIKEPTVVAKKPTPATNIATQKKDSSAEKEEVRPVESSTSAKTADSTPKKESDAKKKSSATATKSSSQKTATKKDEESKVKETSSSKDQKSEKVAASKQSSKAVNTKELQNQNFDLTIKGKTWLNLPKRRVVFRALRFIFASGTTPDEFVKKCDPLPIRFMVKVKGLVDSETFIKRAKEIRKKEGGSFDKDRYFCKDSELIKASGNTYSIWNQWQASNFVSVMSKIIDTYSEHNIKFTPTD